jgi:hypothetical protein
MLILFRGMRAGLDGLPMCAGNSRTLGVRVPEDIAPDEEGLVRPGIGGMSTAPDDPQRLPPHRRPPALHGTGPDPVYGILVAALGGDLRAHQDSLSHAQVEPAKPCTLTFYVEALQATRPRWRRITP